MAASLYRAQFNVICGISLPFQLRNLGLLKGTESEEWRLTQINRAHALTLFLSEAKLDLPRNWSPIHKHLYHTVKLLVFLKAPLKRRHPNSCLPAGIGLFFKSMNTLHRDRTGNCQRYNTKINELCLEYPLPLLLSVCLSLLDWDPFFLLYTTVCLHIPLNSFFLLFYIKVPNSP